MLDYTQAVCSCLRHATAEEKQAVAQELQDHLADHADALVEAGWDPEEAQAHALAAMGEAQEVGQALNQAFPRRWLVLSRLALAALGLLLTIVLSYVLPLGDHLQEAWAIRQDPLHNYHTTFLLGEGNTLENVTPLEGQSYPLPDGSTLVFYGAFPWVQGTDPPYTCLLAVRYPASFWTQNSLALPTLTVPGEGDLPWSPSDSASYGVYGVYFVPPPQGDTLILEYNHFGTTFSISIPWEEVHP